ncbi:MAG: hypothetical protein LBL67_01905 [Coriobacteriales bacterium]|nr:hypothetical protein [Coriobacteriales bacterium]
MDNKEYGPVQVTVTGVDEKTNTESGFSVFRGSLQLPIANVTRKKINCAYGPFLVSGTSKVVNGVVDSLKLRAIYTFFAYRVTPKESPVTVTVFRDDNGDKKFNEGTDTLVARQTYTPPASLTE